MTFTNENLKCFLCWDDGVVKVSFAEVIWCATSCTYFLMPFSYISSFTLWKPSSQGSPHLKTQLQDNSRLLFSWPFSSISFSSFTFPGVSKKLHNALKTMKKQFSDFYFLDMVKILRKLWKIVNFIFVPEDAQYSETYEKTIFRFLFFLRNGWFCTQILEKFGQIFANLIQKR